MEGAAQDPIPAASVVVPETNQTTATETAVATQAPVVPVEDYSTIKYGDQVVLYESVNSMKLQTIVVDGSFQNKFGYFGHSEIVGRKFGEKIFNNRKSAFVYLLRPNPVLLTDTLSHKTQILYQPDISMVIARMNIQPGSIVVESGTGSASLSSSIARTIQEEGHLFTFEFNEERAKNGAEVLRLQKFNNFDVVWRDVITNGFLPIPGEQVYALKQNMADAVFLDLPRPFEAIGHAKKVLKRGGWLCCFSPCIDQVMRNCEEMRRERFVQISTVEVLQREFERRERQYVTAFGPPSSESINVKRKHEELGEEVAPAAAAEEEVNEVEQNDSNAEDSDDNGEGEEKPPTKKNGAAQKKPNEKAGHQQRVPRPLPQKIVRPSITKLVYTSGPKEIKGHTGYLSFGILM